MRVLNLIAIFCASPGIIGRLRELFGLPSPGFAPAPLTAALVHTRATPWEGSRIIKLHITDLESKLETKLRRKKMMSFVKNRRVAAMLLIGVSMSIGGGDALAAVGDLFAVNGRVGGNAGFLLGVNQGNGAGALIGSSGTNGLSGLSFQPGTATLFASSAYRTTNSSDLLVLKGNTGGVISNLGSIRLANGTKIAIADLSFQPGTGTLFGYRGNADGAGKGGELYTINTTTGIATLIGSRGARSTGGGLAFAPDGTLYAIHNSGGFKLSTLSPVTGASLTTTAAGTFLDGLAVRPSDGVIFGTRGGGLGDGIFTITPLGAVAFIGATGTGNGSDLDFQPIPTPGAVLLGLIGLGTVCGWRRRSC